MAQHPYSFSTPDEPSVTESHRRAVALEERGRSAAWDSEAPATAHDWDFERKESRAPLYVAGVTATAILGGLLWLGGAFTGEPELSATIVTETVPRQAALREKLDAEALDRARTAMVGLAPAGLEARSEPVELEASSAEAMTPSAGADASIGPSTAGGMSVEPAMVQSPTSSTLPPVSNEPVTIPAEPAAPPEVVLDRDNPYTIDDESSETVPEAPSSAPRAPAASDNPY